jgi:polyisoprenoid-binding protein YceI
MQLNQYWVRGMIIVFLLHGTGVANAKELIIQQSESEIRVLVYQDSVFSSLGHNHVVHTRNLNGSVFVDEKDFNQSSMSLSFSVSSLIVDDDNIRNQEGEDFPGIISKEDVAGTHKNMMTKVLHAEKFPLINVKSKGITGQRPNFDMVMELVVHGKTTEITVPTIIENEKGFIHAIGETNLLQSDLGLEPFSILFGAIAVQDEITIKFDIVAK